MTRLAMIIMPIFACKIAKQHMSYLTSDTSTYTYSLAVSLV